jgi:hypothetical protein
VLTSDITSVDLEASWEVALGTAPATGQETLLEVTGGYRVSPAVTLFAGARWVDLGSGLRYAGPSGEGEAEVSKSWIDPILGIHLVAPLSQRWWLGVHVTSAVSASARTWPAGLRQHRLSPRSGVGDRRLSRHRHRLPEAAGTTSSAMTC